MSNSRSGGGMSFVGVLTIVFIILKLCGTIDWKWIWIVSPIWISLAFTILIAICLAIWENRNDTWRW